MPAYYNEIEPYAAQWLRELIQRGFIPDGEVDERSIVAVDADDLRDFDQCHFFAGIGGWAFALRLAEWQGEVWTGSCPCQPLSSAGRRQGHVDERHLWPAFYRLIAECRPATIFGEQVASKDGREWLAGVRADLEDLGYAVGAADLPAAWVGAPFLGNRLYFVAAPTGSRLARLDKHRSGVRMEPTAASAERGNNGVSTWLLRPADRASVPTFDGLSRPVDIVRAFGNAIVPQVGAEFVSAFMECQP